MIYFIIIDGLGDETPSPLLKAHKPALDWFAVRGRCANLQIAKQPPESDVGVLSALGAGLKGYTGRGALEALGIGIKLKNALALRANFATVSGKRIVDRRCGRSLKTSEAAQLAELLKLRLNSFSFKLFPSTGHRAVLLVSGKGLSDKITNTDPGYERIGLRSRAISRPKLEIQWCRPLSKPAAATAAAINKFLERAREILESSGVNELRRKRKKLVANWILLRDASCASPKFKALYKGFAACAFMPVERGIAGALGMQVLKNKYSAQAELDAFARLNEEIAAAKAGIALAEKNFAGIYIHFKPVDEAGHDGNSSLKQKMIEALDRKFFSWLKRRFNFEKDLLIVTADHATPCRIRAHTADPVPLLLAGKGIKAEGKRNFFEENPGKMFKGRDLLKIVLSAKSNS